MLLKWIKVSRIFIGIVIVLSLALPAGYASAQDDQPQGPIYVVQPGDSLWGIAQYFRISLDDLVAINNIINPDQISEGDELLIPGLEGIEGKLTTRTVPFGESFLSLSRKYQIETGTLARLNHLTSPSEIYADYSLVLPELNGDPIGYKRVTIGPGQSLLELAVINHVNPWQIIIDNVTDKSIPLPGDVLLIPGEEPDGPGALPASITRIEVNDLPLLQGKTIEISVTSSEGITISGSLRGNKLNFFDLGNGINIALQGIHAMDEPGIYPLSLTGTLADGRKFAHSQNVLLESSNYPYDRPLSVPPATVDPAVTKPESAQWSALADEATPERLWDGKFEFPSSLLPLEYCLETNECWSSRYGNRRSYNGSAYDSFHTGLDIIGGVGDEIISPASGEVVFAGPLTVRGYATMINHGWGVYTGYFHQSEILVDVGDPVEAGQVIGLVGATGRVEGAHLHWEVWVGGVQVEPLDWLKNTFP